MTVRRIWDSVASAAALGACSVLFGARRMRRSQPILEGTVRVAGPRATLRIERDAEGVPSIFARDRRDATFGLGFVHAQDRFYQMDVSRRAGAGELAALFGKAALPFDRLIRPHAGRQTATRALEACSREDRDLLHAYTQGIAAGLSSLRAAPFEYAMLKCPPAPWRDEDALLVVLSFYMLLQLNLGDAAYQRQLLRDALPAAVADFLAPSGTEWDAPLSGDMLPEPRLPSARELDMRCGPALSASWQPDETSRVRGSNSWAVTGACTATGSAMLANDMHLGFSMPNAFYRASLISEEPSWVHGVTAPGYPVVLAGSNGQVAWGLTNAPCAWAELVQLDQRELAPDRYHGPRGVEPISEHEELLEVGGGSAEILRVQRSTLGPIVHTRQDGTRYALQWAAHHARAVNLELKQLELARNVDEALAIAKRGGIPHQSFTAADATGRVGWTILGPVPRRPTRGRLAPRSHEEAAAWQGWLDSDEVPTLREPERGRVWSANARDLGGDALDRLGDGFYLLGARARHIRDALFALEQPDEKAMLALQLDTRAELMDRWAALLLSTLSSAPESDVVARARQFVVDWDGRAKADSVGYRLIRSFRERVEQLTLEPYVALVRARHPDFDLDKVGDQREGAVWRLVSSQPEHLLPQPFASWAALLRQALDQLLREAKRTSRDLTAYRWGARNRLSMQHPFSKFLPIVGRLLDMPSVPLDGDLYVPLAQLTTHGPVMRMVVSPGREHEGILQLPGGPTGHPFAPYFGAGHAAWLRGDATPFLPGETVHRLELAPLEPSA